MRALLRLMTVAALLAAGLMAPTSGDSPARTASAANLAQFDPGNIISDAVFYDYLAMDAGAVQAFLNAKGTYCTAGSLCLKNYSVTTTDRAADSLCSGYRGAGVESAATIIAKVSVACRVNPRVLLVLLQKEMGLVTATAPTARKYERAAGYACPDSANGGCDPRYAGLQNQLYWSAWQYRKYQAYPSNYHHVAGRNNNILWHPNTGCGSSTVYIANQATAGLYNYTPYQPNRAALNAGYSTGDKCSSYGNRNFWNYFTDWFGSTQSSGASSILDLYRAQGGASGWLGAETSGYLCGLVKSGCAQVYQNGVIYWSPSSGAHSVHGAIRVHWDAHRNAGGWLGYPLTDEQCGLVGNGCWQKFENGAIYWSPASSAYSSRGAIRDRWGLLTFENGFLGYPTSDENCSASGDGCWQSFQGGAMYWKPSVGARFVRGPIREHWDRNGNVAGFHGYPVTDEQCGLVGDGCWQQFETGAIYWSPATGAHFNRGAIREKWGTVAYENSSLGYPVTDELCGLPGGGCRQEFQGGALYWGPATGVRSIGGAIREHWRFHGDVSGFHGYPVTDEECGLAGGGCRQRFQHGALYWSPASGVHAVRGAVLERWAAAGGEQGSLGYPTSDEICAEGPMCTSTFQNGAIVWSPSAGAVLTEAPVYAEWNRLGGAAALGVPLSDTRCGLTDGGCSQQFPNGVISSAPGTGAFFVHGAILDAWTASGADRSPLGYPTSGEVCGLAGSGCRQAFANGAVYWSPSSGAHAVSGGIRDAWTANGSENGSWGYPTGDARTSGTTVTQRFTGGTATFDSTAQTVTFG